MLTPTPEFHNAVGIPRTAAIEYPYGRLLGEVADRDQQRAILRATLDVLEQAQKPGTIEHLPFEWHQAPKDTHWHPSAMSPIVKMFLPEIKKARK